MMIVIMLTVVQPTIKMSNHRLLCHAFQLLLVSITCAGALIADDASTETTLPVVSHVFPQSTQQQATQVATSQNVPTSGKKWNHRVITVALDPNLPSMINIAAMHAIDNWNQAQIIRFKLVQSPTADITISPSTLKSAKGHLTLGVTRSQCRGRRIIHADIRIDYPKICRSQLYATPSDVQTASDRDQILKTSTRVVEHELGHALGLNHAKQSVQSVMRSDSSYPMTNIDIQAIRQLYN